jgi:hypothetical protein
MVDTSSGDPRRNPLEELFDEITAGEGPETSFTSDEVVEIIRETHGRR